jgi:hypothetical protein
MQNKKEREAQGKGRGRVMYVRPHTHTHTQQRETLLQQNSVSLCAKNVSAACVLYLVVACLLHKAHVHQRGTPNNESNIDEQLRDFFFRLLKYLK